MVTHSAEKKNAAIASKMRGGTPARLALSLPEAEHATKRSEDAGGGRRRPRRRPRRPRFPLHLRRLVRRRRRYRRQQLFSGGDAWYRLGGRDGSRGPGPVLGRAGRGLPQERHGAGAQAVVHPERRVRQARPLPRLATKAAAAVFIGGDRLESKLVGIHFWKEEKECVFQLCPEHRRRQFGGLQRSNSAESSERANLVLHLERSRVWEFI